MRIIFDSFAGAIPLLAPHKLPPGAAQVAINCDFSTGVLKPIKNSLAVKVVAQPGEARSFYDYTGTWLTWPDEDVSVARAFATDSSGLVYFCDAEGLKKTTKALATAGNEAGWPATVYQGGVPSPAQALTVAYIDIPAEEKTGDVKFTAAYRYTRVTLTGDVLEESAPSPAILAEVEEGYHPRLTNFDAGELPNIVYFRIYRTVRGDATNSLRLVAEAESETTQYDDTQLDDELSVSINETNGWNPPPAGLAGITHGPNTTMIGWIGNRVCLSEPGYPHAWPYSRTFPDDVVAAFLLGSDTIIVLTKGTNQRMTGRDPLAMEQAPISPAMPAIARRAGCVTPLGVAYACENGIAMASPAGTVLFSEHLFTPEQWQALNPANFIFAYANNRLFCIGKGIQDGTNSFFLDVRNPSTVNFFTPDDVAAGNWTIFDARSDGNHVFILGKLAGVAKIHKLMAGGGTCSMTWKSRVVRCYPEQNLGVVQVLCSGEISLSVRSKDDAEECGMDFVGDEIERLPGGYVTPDYSIQVAGTGQLESVVLASTIEELAHGGE